MPNTGPYALNWFHEHYADRLAAARAAKRAGRKVVGYLDNTVPVELIIAAGAFPVRITGDATRQTEVGDRYMEEFFDGPIRSVFDRILRGELAFLDLLIIPRSSEGLLQLYYYLLEMPHWEPDARIPPLHLFDLLQTPSRISGRYDCDRVEELRGRLAALAGKAVDDEAVVKAIASRNALRGEIARVNRMRTGMNPALSGLEMLQIIGACETVDPAECLSAMAVVADMPPRSGGARLMIKGSPQEDDRFTALVESCGAIVVAEEHACGEGSFRHLVSEEGDPLEALAEHYQLNVPSLRSYPQSAADARFIEHAKGTDVEGVIFYLEEEDDTLGWDVPDQRALLERAGIPSVVLNRQSHRRPDRAAQEKAIRDFTASVARKPLGSAA